MSSGQIVGVVQDGEGYFVRLAIHKDGPVGYCSCSGGRARRYLCSHAAALWLDALAEERGDESEDAAERLLGSFELPAEREASLRLHVYITISSVSSVALRVGAHRMYVVHDLHAFLRDYRGGAEVRMGKGLSIDPSVQCFPPDMEAVVGFIGAGLELLAMHGVSEARLRSMPMSDGQLVTLLGLLEGVPWSLILGGKEIRVHQVERGLPLLSFSVGDKEGVLSFAAQSARLCRALDAGARYLLFEDKVFMPSEEERAVIAPFLQEGAPNEYRFSGRQRERLLSEVLPRLRPIAQVSIAPSLREKVIREPLEPRAEFDLEDGEITCKLAFAYGAVSIDPFAPDIREDDTILERDSTLERAILDVLSRHGFRVRAGGAHLSGDEAIYSFLTEGIPAIQALCEVFSSRELLSLRPRRVKPSGRLSVQGGFLEFRLLLEGVEPMDHASVLAALQGQKEFVRLKDGAFLSLSKDDGWAELANYLDEAGGKPDEEGILRMEQYRAVYLNTLLESIGVERDESVRSIVRALDDPREDSPPIEGMRPYQQRGFAWLCALAKLKMGGVLADDMGLGKTLQVLSLIEWGRLRDGTQPTLVVAPTTLTYNWLEEVRKFAPHLDAVVLSGTAQERHEQATQAANCDLIVMSYAQARRDAKFMAEMEFRFVVLDEAQNIKNASTVGAESVKLFRAQARFALTGTPMENHPGELWSLFDFVLPGYLGSQEDFMRRYGSGGNTDNLATRIRPFLMRRLKRDVLSDLPDKIEHRITAELTPQQREVYRATLSRAREEIDGMLKEGGGFERSRFKVLAAITRLRQICCHPSLYLPEYSGGSGKMELLMELVRDAVDSGHRILLFSQFTSMLSLIGEELTDAGIAYFYLDGSVPSQQRIEMAANFNALERPVFLISLRAGGTGLNLTAADTVIHYDPWWNPAVEDQATDRAHRIGQDKVIQVIKLVSRDTIEEKVFELKQHKQGWIDRVVTPGEALPTQLTSQEILSFFA